MSRDTILKAPDGTRYSMDNLCTQNYLEGHPRGAERAVKWLLERAVTLFRDGKDKEAQLLRDVAREMDTKLVAELSQEAKNHQREHPSELKGTK